MARFDVSNYVDVQQRITRFWEEYPEGRIHTELMSLPDEFERVVFRASIYKAWDVERPAATGWAAEVAGGQGANQTSWHENCETSAIGRALANMGYATTGADRPSRQEMQKANRGPAPRAETTNAPQPAPERATAPGSQPQGPPVTPEKLKRMHAMARDLGLADPQWKPTVYKDYGVEHVNELSIAQADAVIARFARKLQQLSAPSIDAAVPPPGEPGNDARTR